MARSITIAVVASVLWLAAFAAHAAGLGRLTVLSALGQPLVAEVEVVSLQPGEEDTLSARLASPDAFSAAGIQISPALLGVRVEITRRNNRPVLRLTTKQPVNEPFLDLLVELQWTTGRLVREYTFLLDPPDYRSRPAIAAAPPAPAIPQAQSAPQPQPEPAPQPQAEAAPQPQAEAQATPAQPAPAEEKPLAAEEKPAAPEEKSAAIEQQPIPPTTPPEAKEEAAKPEAAKEEAAKEQPAKPSTYEVKKGDTLGAIARANLAPGVTLNQMLIAIFRANQDAFIRGNVNLVRTGKILNIPGADSVASVDGDEATRLVKEQNEQFMQYRSRLAAVPSAVEAGPEREAAGRIEPKAEAAAPAAPADQVRLSKAEPGKSGAATSQAAREDDVVAGQRALQEAQSRTAELEKNIADLQKLLDLKNQQLAELEKKAAKPAAQAAQAQAPQAQPQAPAKPAAPPAASAPAPVPAQPAPQAQPPAPQPPGTPAPAAQAQPPQPQAKPQPPTPAAQKPVAAKPAPKPAPPEPSLLDEFLEEPIYLAALAAVVLLLVGYAVWSWRRKKVAHAKFQDSVLGAAAAGGGAAALHEPTANTATSVSQAPVSQAPAGMEADEVDPIAEADVYMAYGRDAQAEEILKEALQKDSNRTAVHAKLLEIYANRKDPRAFEQTALKLKNLTHGTGSEWEKAAALGRSIDPQNSIYGDVAPAPVATAPVAAAGAVPTLDFDLGGASQGAPAAPDISLDEAKESTATTSVDIELGATNTLKLEKQEPDQTLATDAAASGGGLDFDLDLGVPEKAEAAAAAKPAQEPSLGGLDFNLDFDDNKGDSAPPPPPQPIAPPSIDLGEISLDLGVPPAEETVVASQGSNDPKWQEVATKLDLAKAYEEMGDKDGARELLNEVMKDGDNAQKGQAQQLLTKLG